MSSRSSQDSAERLTRLFREHPVWIAAARRLAPEATSTVYLSDSPGRVWHLEQHGGEILLLPESAADPDLVFRFTPQAVDRLEVVDGDVDAYAAELFDLIVDAPLERGVGLRVVASFGRLLRRGYVTLLVSAGPRALAFGAAHGIRSLPALRKLVADHRSGRPASWE
jgi:hypothetical protein